MTDPVDVAPVPAMEPTRRIPAPDGKREPLKVNVFERMSKAAANLVPIFPYDEAGALVPCGTVMFGGEGRDHGHFFHANSVSEVLVTFGSNRAMLQSGAIMATQKVHGVNSFLRDHNDSDGFLVATITQRQSEGAGQHEALFANCTKCKKELVRIEYGSPPSGAPDYDPTRFGNADDKFPQFATLAASIEFIDLRNSEEGRTCSHCGHVNDVFPELPWGWRRMVDQTRVVNKAVQDLTTKAKEAIA